MVEYNHNKVTLFKNATWPVYKSVIIVTSAIETPVSETPRSGSVLSCQTMVEYTLKLNRSC